VSSAFGASSTPDGGRTWVFTFVDGSPYTQTSSSGNFTGSLIDGIYTLSVDPTKVSANGAVMAAAPPSVTFHRLFGDVNGSKNINALDFNAFRSAFGKTSPDPAYNPAFDFDGNGSINALDYNQFRSRFGKTLTY